MWWPWKKKRCVVAEETVAIPAEFMGYYDEKRRWVSAEEYYSQRAPILHKAPKAPVLKATYTRRVEGQ